MKKISNVNVYSILAYAAILLLVALCVLKGSQRIYTSDFFAINGDFQNYNPLRRLLDGQIPFKDFTVYLGSGQLFLCAPLLFLMGGDFTSSLFVSSFMTFFVFEMIVFLVSYFVLHNRIYALFVSLVLSSLNMWYQNLLIALARGDLYHGLYVALAPGNSARMIRAGAVVIVILLVLFCSYRYEKLVVRKQGGKVPDFIRDHRVAVVSFVAGAIASFGIIWSNDVGISSYISFSFMCFIIMVKYFRYNVMKIIRCVCTYVSASILSFLILLAIITKGNVLSWFEFTFGVANYQSWYYGIAELWKAYYIYEIKHSIYELIALLLFLFFSYRLFLAVKSNDSNHNLQSSEIQLLRNDFLLAYLLLTGLINAIVYRLASGGFLNELLYLILFTIIFASVFLILQRLFLKWTIKKYQKKIVCVISILFILLVGIRIFNNFKTIQIQHSKERPGVFVSSLHGYLSKNNMAPDIEKAQQIIGNDKVFSTYASAIEVATNQFQPTGTDYIIHVLGDNQRKKYLEDFIAGDYPFVVTINPAYTPWEYWIRNANWFFYKELYTRYEPVLTAEYFILWKRTTTIESVVMKYDFNVIKVGKSTSRIVLQTNDETYNGVVDTKIAYKSKFDKSFFKTFAINKFVHVKDITLLSINNNEQHASYFIPPKSEGYYIPITIKNGIGEVELDCYPNEHTELEISDVVIGQTYINYFKEKQ